MLFFCCKCYPYSSILQSRIFNLCVTTSFPLISMQHMNICYAMRMPLCLYSVTRIRSTWTHVKWFNTKTRKIDYRLKSKFQGMPSQHLDPLNRFHFEEMSIADHFFSKWLVDSGNNLEIGEKLMKAYLTCHVLRNEACFHCNSKKSLRWNGNFRASWKDLVCLKCNVMYTVKTKASQKDVETAFRSNSFGHQMKIKNKMVPI